MSQANKRQTRVLIFSPHPDDAEFGMGGTVLSLVQANCMVHLAVMTDGGRHPVTSAKKRWIEQEKASELGQYTIECLNLPDGNVAASNGLEVCINTVLNYHPNFVFAPFPETTCSLPSHPDHEVSGQMVREAVRRARIPSAEGRCHVVDYLLYYYLPLGISPTILIDVSQFQNQLPGLWSCFESQLGTKTRSIDLLMAQRITQAAYSNGVPAEAFVAASPLVIVPNNLATILLDNHGGDSEIEYK